MRILYIGKALLVYFVLCLNHIVYAQIGVSVGTRTVLIKNNYNPIVTQLQSAISNANFSGKPVPKISYEVGLNYLCFIHNIQIQSELKYALNECNLLKVNYTNNTTYSVLYSTQVLEGHILLHADISKKIYFLLGPYVQNRINLTTLYKRDKENIEVRPRNGYGISGGLGININNLRIELTDMYSSSIFPTNSPTDSGHIISLKLITITSKKKSRFF